MLLLPKSFSRKLDFSRDTPHDEAGFIVVSEEWFDPSMADLFQVSFPGVKTSRDGFLIDVDLDRLEARVRDYFDTALSHEDIERRYPSVMNDTARFDARAVREALLKRGGPDEAGFIRFAYRPFDIRWLYWEKDTKLLDEKRTDYRSHVFEGNLWIEAREREAKGDFSRGTAVRHMADNFGNGLSSYFPAWRLENGAVKGNLKQPKYVGEETVQHYLDRLGLGVEDLVHHVLAVLHDPAYREANADALRMEWPRIPLPDWPNGKAHAAALLSKSAARGRELAALLDCESTVDGVTHPPLRPEIASVAVPTTVEGRNMAGDDFAVAAGWGHIGAGDAVMPGQGRAVERAYTPEERAALRQALPALGESTFDIYLNGRAFWRNVPAAVWGYKLSGYQVLKKWLSYREEHVLGRPLLPKDIRHFCDTARRIGALLMIPQSTGSLFN